MRQKPEKTLQQQTSVFVTELQMTKIWRKNFQYFVAYYCSRVNILNEPESLSVNWNLIQAPRVGQKIHFVSSANHHTWGQEKLLLENTQPVQSLLFLNGKKTDDGSLGGCSKHIRPKMSLGDNQFCAQNITT